MIGAECTTSWPTESDKEYRERNSFSPFRCTVEKQVVRQYRYIAGEVCYVCPGMKRLKS